MKVLFLEPFFGGSHKDFALGFKAAFRHEVTLVTLPDRFWKWRMRGAALDFVSRVKDFSVYDLILATDMLDLTDLMALAEFGSGSGACRGSGTGLPPVWLYFHESQFDYPLAPGEKRDFHLGFTNLVSAAAADRVFFNSNSHMTAFFDHAEELIRRMPDHRPDWMPERIKARSRVIYPGCRFEKGDLELLPRDSGPPLIIWNHRWEHDKNPEPFFRALRRLKKKDIGFSLAVLGENFSKAPACFKQAEKEFGDELVAFGYCESREDYLAWLEKGSIVVSCANQENFGISVVEAVRHGCLPLLPDRLSYPELIPEAFHSKVLYETDHQFETRLEQALMNPEEYEPVRKALSAHMERFAWENIISEYHDLAARL